MPETPFVETEALLLAIEDLEADSGNHDPLKEYLRENFHPNEVIKLKDACYRLAYVIEDLQWEI